MSDDAARAAGDRPPLFGNWLSVLEERLAACERLSLCLDFDGTLAPVVEDPDDARLPARTRDILESLADHPGIDLAVISGRALDDLAGRVDVAGCALAGNHGLEIQTGDGRWIHPSVAERRPELEAAVDAIEERIESVPGCHLEDKGLTATVHVRGADVDRGTARDVVEDVLDGLERLEATVGRQVVEVRPRVDWDKGRAVRRVVDEGSAAIYVGDDATDEDAFRTLAELPAGGVGILVGDRPSRADFRVHDVDSVRAFLEWLDTCDALRPAPAAATDGTGSPP